MYDRPSFISIKANLLTSVKGGLWILNSTQHWLELWRNWIRNSLSFLACVQELDDEKAIIRRGRKSISLLYLGLILETKLIPNLMPTTSVRESMWATLCTQDRTKQNWSIGHYIRFHDKFQLRMLEKVRFQHWVHC